METRIVVAELTQHSKGLCDRLDRLTESINKLTEAIFLLDARLSPVVEGRGAKPGAQLHS